MVSKIIRVPERKYIETLIVGRNNSSLIIDELQIHNIPIPVNDMKAIYENVVKSNPKYFQDETLPYEEEWIESLKISPMFYYRFKKPTEVSLAGCAGAFKILEDPKVTKYIHALLLNGVPKDDIELIINARYNIAYDTPDFEVYIHNFANYDNWTYQDKELFVASIQDPDQKKTYKKAISQDRSELIWELGLGSDPKASFEEMLKDMFTDSYFYFKKNLKYSTEDSHKFAALAVKLADRMDQMEDKKKEEMDIFKELQFKLQTESTKKSKSKEIIDRNDMDVEVPERSDKIIPDLSKLMNTAAED
jgi:hypothetical protein